MADGAADGAPPPKRPRQEERRGEHFTEHFTDPDVDNLRIREVYAVMSPQLLLAELPMTLEGKSTVMRARKEVREILGGRDDRLLVIVGPHSIHDPTCAIEFAQRLRAEKRRFAADLVLLMRVYFDKPQPSREWQGLVNDPALDHSFMVNSGLRMTRKLLQEINHVGVACAVEFLDAMSPQYFADLVSWSGIGSQTVESALHRDVASGLSVPVGFKNHPGGDVDVAMDACRSATKPHCFFGETKQGTTAIVHSLGNPDVNLVLSGGKAAPNHMEGDVRAALERLAGEPELPQGLVIDCAGNANALGDFRRQPAVAEEVCSQLRAGQRGIVGLILESNLVGGSQALPMPEGEPDFGHRRRALLCGVGTGGDIGEAVRSKLRYGVSVTDPCIDWPTTVQALEKLAAAVQRRRSAAKEAA